jgi:putative ABC transport system permease protein
MRSLLRLAWRDLRGSGRTLWVLCACLTLGVTLIAASGGLYRQVGATLLADTRVLFGGDLEVRTRAPLPEAMLEWMQARGTVSRLIEFRTMLMTEAGDAHLVELQSTDDAYPLYGTVELLPAQALNEAYAVRDGVHGAAIDRVLADRLALTVGDRIELGVSLLEVRAVIARQPDRSLRADWSGPPVLISAAALAETALLQPGSRPDYRYRVRSELAPDAWRDAFMSTFPDSDADVRTFIERNARLGEVLGQIGSGVLLIGVSALFIGGLGVFNSVQAYLQGKLGTLATLRVIGLRDGRLAAVYLLQILILASASALAGVLLGALLAMMGSSAVARRLPLAADWTVLLAPLAAAGLMGVLIALLFALPALGRALTVEPAALFRDVLGVTTRTPARAWWLTAVCALVAIGFLLVVMPDPLFGLAFVAASLLVLALLEGLVRVLGMAARRLAISPWLVGRFALRMAVTGLYRADSPLRPTLLSLGSALTLLVASTLVVLALLHTIDETVPERAPALVFYDIAATQKDDFEALVRDAPSLEQLDLAPLVLGRLAAVNAEELRDSADPRRRLEARDEHKMSTLQNNFDQVVVTRGAWWPDDYRGPARVAMEDREADQLGLQVGDTLVFEILGQRGQRDVGRDLCTEALPVASVAGGDLFRRRARSLHHPLCRHGVPGWRGCGRDAEPHRRFATQCGHGAHRPAPRRGPRHPRPGCSRPERHCRDHPDRQPAGTDQRDRREPSAANPSRHLAQHARCPGPCHRPRPVPGVSAACHTDDGFRQPGRRCAGHTAAALPARTRCTLGLVHRQRSRGADQRGIARARCALSAAPAARVAGSAVAQRRRLISMPV